MGDANDESRRRFLIGAAKAGSAAGALLWVAPQMTSVAFAQDVAGTAPPDTPAPTNVTVPPGAPPGTRPGELPLGEGPRSLPLTGTNAAAMTLVGGAAVAAGRALMLARRRSPEVSARPVLPRPADRT